MIRVHDARFLITAVRPEHYPNADLPEIAFAGRSNVGKSSMINALAGRKKLVRVSNTPGRTRTLNFFDVDLGREETKRTLRLADLPGYGYAKVSKDERRGWEIMITSYLSRRKSLKVCVSIIDGEIGPTPVDMQTLDYLVESGRQLLVVATKIDRVPKAQRKPKMKQWAQQLGLEERMVIPFSATDRIGVDEVWEALWDAT